MKARRTRPWRTSSPSTKLGGVDRHRKADALRAADDRGVDADDCAVARHTSAPPELPGLSAASVWITSSISRPLSPRNVRRNAEMTPAVTVACNPSGLPIAIANSPRLRLLELGRP